MKEKHVAIYVSGGIAAYKAAILARLFVKQGAKVKVAMTKAAQAFVTPLTFKGLTHQEVYTDLFENDSPVPHIELADWTDLAVVVPATANVIAKMANGIADDFVTTALLATAAPKYVVPAMNDKMWSDPATKRNIARLQDDGVAILEPVTGLLAEGYTGKGRMPDPEAIYAWIAEVENIEQDLKGKKVLISAGGTREAIDPVRYIANRSSGKMGYALAKRALVRGAEVILVTGPTKLTPPVGVTTYEVQTTAELEKAMLTHYADQDIVIMAAAVADYRVKTVAEQKIKKNAETWQLELVKNPDILKRLGELKRDQILVGFAAETTDLLHHATKKLQQKNADLLVANDVSRKDIGFGADDNEAWLLTSKNSPKATGKLKKTQLADLILSFALQLRGEC